MRSDRRTVVSFSPPFFLGRRSSREGPMYNNRPSMPAVFRGSGSMSIVLWTLVLFFITVHIYYTLVQHRNGFHGNIQMHNGGVSLYSELEKVDEEFITIPPPKGKRSPRALKRRPKKIFSLLDEFMDDSSRMRHLFFPDQTSAIDPRGNLRNDSFHFYPGRIWLDTDGVPIQAHGGGILYDDRLKKYFWYGEYKDGPTYRSHKKATWRVDVMGVGCYSSKDLWAWKNEGIVLAAEQANETHDLHSSKVVERPKVIYNRKSNKYVMWMHVDDANYTKASVGISSSNSPTGPFEYLRSVEPHGYDSRDMTLFRDDDGAAYLIYSSEGNSVLHVSPLTTDYLDVTEPMSRVLIQQHREAPALFKHRGSYYMVTSGCTGWAPNEALVHTADSVMGPWEIVGNPCVGGNKEYRITTFFSQSTHVVPLPGLPDIFIFMADRWNPFDLRDSRYVWLPLLVTESAVPPPGRSLGFPLHHGVSVYWHRSWALPRGWSGSNSI